ncbi:MULTISPECIES: hypothetical protein [Catenuloplanes]|uniref:Uncharacterized protein n=1 Tax=Catenuloplanes niger TaxID=587534 RepID=A0AAE3ZNI5_9ACTN|nr:hypothetical protein [Catenuloplanes niger]MDR7322157.1 hypothetical protein [Catenuloplanes niger]
MDSRMWRACAEQYLIPHLPGEWKVTGDLLHTQSSEWIVCGLHPNRYPAASWFKVERLVQLLARPHKYRVGPFYETLPERNATGTLPLPENAEGARAVMSDILTAIHQDALPYFAHAGTLTGYKELIQDRSNSGPYDCNHYEALCYIHVIQGDVDAARKAASTILLGPEQYEKKYFAALTNRVRRIDKLAASDITAAQDLLRNWSADTWKEISKVGH